MSKIIVTGSAGFIGKELVIKLRDSGHEVLALSHLSGDITDKQLWSDLPQNEVVVHLAARTFVPDSWSDPAGFLQTNFQGTICALNYCNQHKARLVFLSSYMYGSPAYLPIPESAPVIAYNPYALSKKLAEDACRFYADHFNVKINILRPFNVYGPDQPDNFLIPSVIRQTLEGNAICVKDLHPKRDYVYIEDVISCICKAVDLDQRFNIFNIGTGISYSVAELIDLIQENLGTALPVHSSNERRSEEVMDTRADISRAKEILGWSPKWSLKNGIATILAKRV